MANAWPQRALCPWARAKKKGGADTYPTVVPYLPDGGPPFFGGPGPKALCGHVWAYLIYFVIKWIQN